MAISRLKATVGVDPDYQFAKVGSSAHTLEGISSIVEFEDFINDGGDPMGGHECDHLRKHGPRANINAPHTNRFAHNIGWRNLSPGAGQNANQLYGATDACRGNRLLQSAWPSNLNDSVHAVALGKVKDGGFPIRGGTVIYGTIGAKRLGAREFLVA